MWSGPEIVSTSIAGMTSPKFLRPKILQRTIIGIQKDERRET
jgi:hypothetical protein